MPERSRFLTAAQVGDRLGLSVKALRVLERHGLMAPGRTAAGWRVYGPGDLARLHQILALRQLGLRLAEVARLIGGGEPDLDRTLALQEHALVETQRSTDRALAVVRRARSRLAAGDELSAEDLIRMIKETVAMNEPTKASPELKALIERHYSPGQLASLQARPFTKADQARVSAAWAAIYEEADRLAAADAGAGTPEALDLARRARALIEEFTQGDAGIAASLRALWREAATAPQPPFPMPGTPRARAFLEQARERLAAAGA